MHAQIQKGLLQIGKGLQFLHEQAKLVHLGLTEDAIVINSKVRPGHLTQGAKWTTMAQGDWKLAGFGPSTYLTQTDGQPARWQFPEQDSRLANAAQLNLDYLAPEYAVDEQAPSPANDLYSLGCIVYAIHSHAGPPFRNHGELQQLRSNVDNLGVLRAQWSRLPEEVQGACVSMSLPLMLITPPRRPRPARHPLPVYSPNRRVVSNQPLLQQCPRRDVALPRPR
jgi:SCY1-like protein 2